MTTDNCAWCGTSAFACEGITAVNGGTCCKDCQHPIPADAELREALAAIEKADGYLRHGSEWTGHKAPDPIAAHIVLDQAAAAIRAAIGESGR